MTIATRRVLLAGLACAAFAPPLGAEPLPDVAVTKDPSCGCCDAWVEHMRKGGFRVVVHEAPVNPLKAKLGVPRELYSCHTAQVGPYVVEGHVPATAVRRLLAMRPAAIGLAVPGMPIGSPGMEVEGAAPDTFDVVLFGPKGRNVFARFEGSREI